MNVYRVTEDNNIIRVSRRSSTIKVLNSSRGASGAPGLMQSVVAGDNITVDNTDPANPIVSLSPLDTDDIADTATNRYTNDTDITRLANTSGTNTGDQDLSGLVTLTTTQTISGAKTFSTNVNLSDNRITNLGGIAYDITPTIPTYAEGNVYWDGTDHTLAIQQGVDDVTLQVGQEIYVRARNSTGSTITNGQIVYISGATGNRPNITLAQANSVTTSNVIGMATHNIENNSDGLVTIFGKVNDLNTSGFSDGDSVYLSATTPGAMTTIPPVIPNQQILVGTVIRSSPSQGAILFRAQAVPQMRATSVPANATATGTAGSVAYDASFLYICVATNTWRRTALSSW